MKINEIIYSRLENIYLNDPDSLVELIGDVIKPEIRNIVNIFYGELLEIPETAPILENKLVEKNLPEALAQWLNMFFLCSSKEDIHVLIERQKEIGVIHANIHVHLNYFNYGIGIIKREIYKRISAKFSKHARFQDMFLTIGEIFDILISIISESYFSKELVHESNELSLKLKGFTQNTAIECERLRSTLLEWARNTLTFLYQSPGDIDISNIPRLQYSNFGLWVIYKADFLSHSLNVSDDLKIHINVIDESLRRAAKFRIENDDPNFLNAVKSFNEKITKTSWFISTIVDQALEIDTGMDPLTRLFNRRYLDTILRRQTEICIRQDMPYSVLIVDIDHFKKINDQYGHDIGDSVLKQFSEILLLSVRTSDFVFRYGGEEFLLVLGNVDQDKAYKIAEKIRKKTNHNRFKLPGDRHINLSCSIGISVHDGHPDYNRLVKKADIAVYKAKQGGRNRSEFADN